MEHFSVIKDLKRAGSKSKAKILAGFFKTGKGEYGHGDKFLGVNVPKQRKIAKNYEQIDLKEIEKLLKNEFHECRLTGLFILISQYKKADEEKQKILFHFYLRNIGSINNWDLVDSSAPYILGHYLLTNNNRTLFQLARSKNLWKRRIAIVATLGFIKKGRYEETLEIAEMLLDDPHDLIHKAAGWMLREVGKKSPTTEKSFLNKNSSKMPRTMLRYAIERFPEKERKKYMLSKN